MRYLFLTLFLTFAFIYWPPGKAYAQQACMPRQTLESRLLETYKETPYIATVTTKGELLQIFYNPHKGNWTLTITQGNSGMSCIIATGESFISLWKHPVPEQEI